MRALCYTEQAKHEDAIEEVSHENELSESSVRAIGKTGKTHKTSLLRWTVRRASFERALHDLPCAFQLQICLPENDKSMSSDIKGIANGVNARS